MREEKKKDGKKKNHQSSANKDPSLTFFFLIFCLSPLSRPSCTYMNSLPVGKHLQKSVHPYCLLNTSRSLPSDSQVEKGYNHQVTHKNILTNSVSKMSQNQPDIEEIDIVKHNILPHSREKKWDKSNAL